MMRYIVSNTIRIVDPTYEMKNYIEENLVMKNPQFEQLQRMNKWTGNTPRHLVWYEIDGNDLIVPFGFLDMLWKFDNNKEHYENRIVMGESLSYRSKIKLFEYQENVVQRALHKKNGGIIMPAGSGKTETAMELICRIGKKALWITHTLDLVNQSYNRAKEKIDDIGLGKIANGRVEIGSHITFATVQTLSKLDLNEYSDKWDVIVVDEGHRICGTPAAAGMFYKVINKLIARYKYFLTATPYRNVKGTERAMFSLLGGIIIELDKEVIGDRIIPAKVIKVKTNFIEVPEECKETDGTIKYALLTTALSEDYERNSLIIDILKDCKSNYTLVLGDRVNQLYGLKNELGYGNVIDGNTKKDIRENSIQEVRDGKEKVLFATYGLAKEGLDIPRLDRLILASPHRDKATIVQSIGRIERKYEGKTEPICYDLVDRLEYFEKMYKARRSYYKKNNNLIEED